MPLCCLKQHRNPLGKIWCTECDSLIAGAAIGDYVINSHLGQDSTSAAVYLAHQPKLNNRKVVIKVLHAVASQESIDTFRKEAAVLASLSHPYILPIYDYDIIEEVRVDQLGNYSYSPYLVLRYAEQGSLDDIFKQEGNRPWSLERVLPIIKEVAEALDYAHGQGILHRDVKPANILMVGAHIMSADFGVADLIDVDKSHLDSPWAGSPAYMAPEVWGYKPGRYSDQYALAVTCFRLLTGEYPWKIVTGGTTQWMNAHQYVAPLSLRSLRPDLPVAVGLVLQRALAKKPHDRYPSVGAFARELRKAAQDETQHLVPPARLPPPRPALEAAPSPAPGSQGKSAQIQVEKARPALPSLTSSGSTSSIQPLFEEPPQNGEDPIGKIDITGSLSREISQKLQSSRWTLPAFILNLVICVVLVAAGWFSYGGDIARLLALFLWPALLVGPLVGLLFHRVPVSSYAWGVLWGMIFGIVNAFLSALACSVLFIVIFLREVYPSLVLYQLATLPQQPSLLLLFSVGFWLSVFGSIIPALIFARERDIVLSAQPILFDRGRRRTEAETTTKSLLSLFALARTSLEEGGGAFVRTAYIVQAGISGSRSGSFKWLPFNVSVLNLDEPIMFDISLHASDNIELTGEWQKDLRYDPQNAELQFVEFSFRAIVPGPCSLTVDFYRERHLLQTIRIEFEAVEQPTPATAVGEG